MKRHDVVISGMAGTFPESDNINELKENLMKKINLVTTDDRKWNKDDMDVPFPTGKLTESDAFDDMFFGISLKYSLVLDQHVKLCLEATYGAICDAGLNPSELSGTDTAVIGCSCLSDSEYEKNQQFHLRSGALITGASRAMQSNRISFHLNTKGPSFSTDSSWNGCFDGIQYAYDRISKGTLKAAIVTSCNLIYVPEASYHWKRMGRLNSDGCTKSFSDDADGYSRSEACVAFFIQKQEDALRSYGTVLGVSDSSQEGKNCYFADVSPGQFLPALKNVYDVHNTDPRSVAFIEAAGSASKVIDAEELNTIAELMLPGREDPLLIGCVKSNLGHCEASADAVALVKALIAADSGIISPNLHYSSPNSMVPALVSEKLKVVTEPTTLKGEIIGINSISAIGSIKHVIIKQHDKKKTLEPEVGKLPPDGIPRLFIMTGRVRKATENTLRTVQNMPLDVEFIALANRLFKNGIKNHMFRGYTVINHHRENISEINEFFTGKKTGKIWFVFTGMGSQWQGMGTQLLKIPTFARTIEKCHEVLEPNGLNIYDILTTDDPKIFDDVINSFVGIAAIQIGLVDILYELGIYPDGIIGHSVGELGCAYADGCLTAEQMIRCAYARGVASHVKLIPGLMAAVGKGYNSLKDKIPEGIDVACHNSKYNCTLSGPAESMKEYVETLTAQNIFARLVNTANIAYHSRYIQPAGPTLLQKLKKIIPEPKVRSKKWICTSVPEAQWDTDLAKYCSAEYQTNNLLSSVLFEEASKHIPKDATVIEIAPHGLLQAVLKQILPQANHIPLTRRGYQDGLTYFLRALGKMYINGHSFNIEKLYPPIDYPVSRGTPAISPLLNWDHSNICTPSFNLLKEFYKKGKPEESYAEKALTLDFGKGFDGLRGYQLKGVPTIPFGNYLVCGINELKKHTDIVFHLVQFKNVRMLKYIDTIDKCQLSSQFQFGTGNWEICLSNEVIFKAQVNVLHNYKFPEVQRREVQNDPGSKFYERLNQFGLQLEPTFKLIERFTLSNEGVSAAVIWDGKLMNFLEAVLQVPVAGCKDASSLMTVTSVSSITIDLHKFRTTQRKEVNVHFNKITKVLFCEGLYIVGPVISPVNMKSRKEFVFQEPHFVPYEASIVNNINCFLTLVKEIVCSDLTIGSISSNDLSLFIVGEEINIYEEIYSAFQNVQHLNVFVKIIPDNQLLRDQAINWDSKKNVLIATASPSISESIGMISHSRQGYILIRDQPLPRGFEVVVAKKIGDDQYYFCKERNDVGGCSFIFLSSNDWKSELQYYLNTSTVRPVYLVGHVTKLSKIYNIIEETRQFSSSHILRYIFHDLKAEEFQPMLFKDQLSKGLRINIFRENNWGLIALKVLQVPSLPRHQLGPNSTYTFSQILMDDTQVKAIGLNSSDLRATNNERPIIEFSGVNKEGNICGIGCLDELTQQIKLDSILKWEKPHYLSHEEVVSVLLPYSMAYYILKVQEKRRKLECVNTTTILVHCGHLPLSQAVINVALSEGLQVFTTYQTNNERELITKLFPMIPMRNIFSIKTIDFVDILIKNTNGTGINIIVSSLSDKQTTFANTLLVSQRGVIYQTDFEKSPYDTYVGMYVFLTEVAINGFTPSSILFLPNNEKETLKNIVNNALRSEEIKPLPMKVVTNNIDSFIAKELLKDSAFINSKIVVSKNGKYGKKSPLNLCEEDAHYMIIVPAEEQVHLWIKILEWLISRRALNIHIIIDWRRHPEFIHDIFDNIQNKNPSVNLKSETVKLFSPVGKLRHYIHAIKQTGKLSSIFISSEKEPENLKSICEAAGDSRIIYFTNKFEATFEENAKNGLIVVDQDSTLDTDNLASFIDSLVQFNNKLLILSNAFQLNSSIVVDDPWKAYNQHLPWTVEEVLYLSQNTKKFGWNEVRTNTSRLQENKGLTPVLIISPIKKDQLDKLIKSLLNPAFEALIPTNCDSIGELVQGLFKEVMKFRNNEFTLLCSDWSFSIGVELGKVLESADKKVNIVFLQPVLDWKCPKLYQAIHHEVSKQSKHNYMLEHKRKLLQTGFAVIKKRLEWIQNGFTFAEKGRKLQGVVVLIKTTFSSNTLLSELSKHCENPVIVHCSEEKSHLEMLNSKETADVINSVAIINYTDAATTLPKSFTVKRYFENPRHKVFQRLLNDFTRPLKKQ